MAGDAEQERQRAAKWLLAVHSLVAAGVATGRFSLFRFRDLYIPVALDFHNSTRDDD